MKHTHARPQSQDKPQRRSFSLKGYLQEKIWHKQWMDQEIQDIVGQQQKTFLTYAQDPALRTGAASGGSTTALLTYLLRTRQVDGALVLRTIVKDGMARPEFLIAQNEDELIGAQGSKYAAVYFTQDAFPLIKSFPGRLAVVALPCDAMLLSRHRTQNPDFDEKIRFVITLVCGHNSTHELTDLVVDKLRPDKHSKLAQYSYRTGHWRGNLTAKFDGGQEIVKPFSFFSDYRNVYFFAQVKCHHCFDHFGYYCDISAGDIWSPEMKHKPVKHTALIARTQDGVNLIEQAIQSGKLVGEEVDVQVVLNGQARTAPFHHNISSRSKVGKLFGIKIRDEKKTRVRWNDYLIAFIALANQRFSETRLGRRLIPRIPRPILKLYLYIFKGLESI